MKKTTTLFFVLFALFNLCNAQIFLPKGIDIDGEASNDDSGWSVSMPDANTLAIGGPYNGGNGNFAGHVRIYSWNGTSWVQKGSDIDGEAAGDNSGWSVSMPDSNTVAIGAFLNDGSGTSAGHVRIYSWNGTAWTQKGSDIDGEATSDQSGYSVSMPDSNTVVIGAIRNDGNGSNSGHVRIYSWNGTAWVQKGSDIDGEATIDNSGCSVSMPDANTVAIGAIQNSGNGTYAGHVRIYSWNGTAWVQKGSDIDGEAAGNNFGYTVSMPDSNIVAIGAPHNSGNGTSAGHVRIYSWNGTAWVQKGSDIDGEAANDQSGYSVSMPDSNTVAIGALYNDGNGSNSGQVRIYSWNGTVWVQKGIDINGETAADNSGFSVSMPDANTVAIGATNNDGNGSDAGHVRIYSFCNATAATLSVSACDSYVSPSGNYTWTSNGTYMDTIPNQAGCDSVITVNLTIGNSSQSIISPIACDSYVSPSGNYTWTSNGTYMDTIPNLSGCDSIITVNLTINNSSQGTISPIACDSYVSPSGNYTWTANGTYMDTIPNLSGCDSVITINLTINNVNTGVTNSSPTLTANAAGATYQWLDCNNNFAVIAGATNQSITATANGSYAVAVTQNNCTDTSACEQVTGIGILENSFGNSLLVYPNPASSGQVAVTLPSSDNYTSYEVFDVSGNTLHTGTSASNRFEIDVAGLSAGMYIIKVLQNDRSFYGQLIVTPL